MAQKALTPGRPTRQLPADKGQPHRFGRWIAPAVLAMLVLAVILTAGLQAPMPAQAHEEEGHTHVCTSPPAESCPGYDDVAVPITYWATTMTVGQLTEVGSPVFQYSGYRPPGAGSLGTTEFTYRGTNYSIGRLHTAKSPVGDVLSIEIQPIFPSTFASTLTLELNGRRFLLKEGSRTDFQATESNEFTWSDHSITWSENESVAVKLIDLSPPNAYGYRTIWNALMTAEVNPNNAGTIGFFSELYGKLTNNRIVDGRADLGRIPEGDEVRYPWSGYEIKGLYAIDQSGFFLEFYSDSYPTADEGAGWTLVLPGGKELPFPNAPVHNATPHKWGFSYAPNWADGDQVVVSIRTKEVQNRVGQIIFRATDPSLAGNIHSISKNRWSGSSFIGDSSFNVQGHKFSLELLEVIRKGTDDEDPVWITATFRAPNEGMSWTGYWEGEFEQFHTLYLRWYDHLNKRPSTYTLPLKTAATEGGIRRSGRNVSFVWVRTHKEFERRGLALARQADIYADMLAQPKPATARSTTSIQNTGSQHGLYTPAPTVTSAEFTSNPGDDQTYGPGDVIQATLTFDQEVTVRYADSKRQAQPACSWR